MRRPDGKTVARYWEDPICSPSKEMMKSMYSAGYKLYIDGKRQTLTAALATIPEHLFSAPIVKEIPNA